MTGPDLPAWKAENFCNHALQEVVTRFGGRRDRLSANSRPVQRRFRHPVAARRQLTFARVAELADALDSKSSAR